jgi:hypothetical protein
LFFKKIFLYTLKILNWRVTMLIDAVDDSTSGEWSKTLDTSIWNGREVQPLFFSEEISFNLKHHRLINDSLYPYELQINLINKSVRAIRHTGRKTKKLYENHGKAILIIAAAIAVIAGTATSGAVATVASAAVAPSSGGTRRKNEKETPPTSSSPPEDPPSFHSQNPDFSRKTFEISGVKLARGAIGGINGIGNNLDQAKANAGYLSQLSCSHHVEWVHNQSHSIPVDIVEIILFNYKGYSAPAKHLMENWMKFHEEHKNNPHSKYLQVCHSQGATHVRNALQNAPKEIRNRIIVVAIAPSSVVPKELCFESFNYASKRDPIPLSEAVLNYNPYTPYEKRMAEPSHAALKELILLEPHPDAARFDHNFDSPTFKEPISYHISEYIKQYGDSK